MNTKPEIMYGGRFIVAVMEFLLFSLRWQSNARQSITGSSRLNRTNYEAIGLHEGNLARKY